MSLAVSDQHHYGDFADTTATRKLDVVEAGLEWRLAFISHTLDILPPKLMLNHDPANLFF